MTRLRQVLLAVLGMSLGGAIVGEHLSRRAVERRYQQEVEGRQQLELQFGEVLATHEGLKTSLKKEQQRSKELTEALASTRTRLEEAVGRLSEEFQTVRELNVRLAGMQQQMAQLQGELAVILEESQEGQAAGQSNIVQLDRIVVTDPGATGLQGRVVSIHRDWNFVVIDLGWDSVKIGDTVSIFRNDQLLAKARIERVQEGLCAATVLPEWETAQIQVNDFVRIL